MPYETAVLPAYCLGLVRLRGVVTGDTIIEALSPLYGSETWRPGYNTIWDARGVSQVVVSPAQAASIVDRVCQLEERMGCSHTAVIVRNESQHALADMLIDAADTGHRQRKAFYTLEEAVGWILTADTHPREELLQEIAQFLSRWRRN